MRVIEAASIIALNNAQDLIPSLILKWNIALMDMIIGETRTYSTKGMNEVNAKDFIIGRSQI